MFPRARQTMGNTGTEIREVLGVNPSCVLSMKKFTCLGAVSASLLGIIIPIAQDGCRT